jgi:hypothetical protein
MRVGHWRNRPVTERQGSAEHFLDLVSVYKEASRNFVVYIGTYFSLEQGRLKIKNYRGMYRKY